MSLQKLQIDFTSALNYFKFTSYETNELFRQLVDSLNKEAGEFYTYLPEDISPNEVQWFNSDILYRKANLEREKILSDTRKELFNKISHHLLLKPNNIILFEEITFKRTNITGQMFNIAREIFDLVGINFNDDLYYLFKDAKNLNKISEYVLWQDPFISIFSQCDNLNSKDTTLTTLQFNEIIEKTKSIIIGAYCGLGFIVWEQKQKGN